MTYNKKQINQSTKTQLFIVQQLFIILPVVRGWKNLTGFLPEAIPDETHIFILRLLPGPEVIKLFTFTPTCTLESKRGIKAIYQISYVLNMRFNLRDL